MTREEIKNLFPDATDEQITTLLNNHHKEVQKEKERLAGYKAENDRLKAIEKEAEDLKNANLTAEQKAQKAIEEAEAAKKDFVIRLNRLDAEKLFVASNLDSEAYAPILDGIVTDDPEQTKILAQNILSLVQSQKEAAAKSTEAQLLSKTPRPEVGGSNGITKEQLRKMSARERYEYAVQNPEQYKQLYGGNE